MGAKKAEYAAERERQRQLELATVAFFQPGEMQPERDFDFQSQGAEFDETNRVQGRAYRRAKDWMSCVMPVAAGRPLALVVTYFQDEWRRRTFDILVDGEKIAEQVVERGGVPHFFDVALSHSRRAARRQEKDHRALPGDARQRDGEGVRGAG